LQQRLSTTQTKNAAEIEQVKPEGKVALDALQAENANLRKRLASYEKPKLTHPSARFATLRDSLKDAIKHLNESGVPTYDVITLLGGAYTLVATTNSSAYFDLDKQMCTLVLTNTALPPSSKESEQRNVF
jgi:hypothetical protein